MNDFFESTLEDLIVNNPEECIKRGFPKLNDKTFKQILLPSGRLPDIMSVTQNDTYYLCKIFELKRDCLDIQSAVQVLQYAKEVNELAVKDGAKSISVTSFLVGNSITNELKLLIANGLNVGVVLYEYKLTGITFILQQPEI